MIVFFLQSKTFRIVLAGCIFQLLLNESTFAFEQNAASVNNIRHTVANTKVTILYDLKGIAEHSYSVNLVMLSKDNQKFSYIPQHVTGDIGEGVQQGENHSVIWDTKDEFPGGITSGNYYFSLQAKEDTSSSISPWIWVGGALVVGGIIFLVAKKGNNDGSQSSFPQPPGRP